MTDRWQKYDKLIDEMNSAILCNLHDLTKLRSEIERIGSEIFEHGYDEGLVAGDDRGYERGYDMGYDMGYERGFDSGKDD